MPKAPEPSSTCQNTTKSLPRISPKSYCYNAVPNRFSSRFSTSRTNGPRLLSLPKAGTHSPFREKSHTRAHTPKQGCFGWGWYHYSRSVPHVHQHPRAGYQNGKFCRFWGLVGGAPEERRKPTGQRCAYARRCPVGVAAPLGCVIFSVSVEIAACMPCAQGLSACARHGRYHYLRRALRAAETPDGRLSKRLICRFLRSGEQRSLRSAYFFRICRIFCRQFQLQTLLRYGTIKTDEPRTLDFSGVRGFLVTNVCIVQRSAA